MTDIVIEHDLRHLFGASRDQGARPTCLAFAVSDAHAAVRGGVWQPLSCEYLYYYSIQRAGSGPSDGAKPSAILKAIEHDGQPVETGWPYLTKPPADRTLWKPPADVDEVFRRAGESGKDTFDAAWDLVATGRPAVICMSLSDAFYFPLSGVVDAAEPVDPIRLHAVVAVAAGRRDSSRLLLIRNSWGEHWGSSGNAWLTEAYLAKRVIGVLKLKKVV